MNASSPILVVHSADELYGSDRMLLEVLLALPDAVRDRCLVWLPTDVPHGASPLCSRLAEIGVRAEHVDLPVIRRRYLTPTGLAHVTRRMARMRRPIASVAPTMLLMTTSAALPVSYALPRRRRPEVVLYLQEVWEAREARALGHLAGRVDRVVAVSEAARASLPPRLSASAAVVPNATPDPGEWAPVDPSGSEMVFLVASRWMPRKGHEVLLRAWDEAGSPGRLVILGGPPPVGASIDVRTLAATAANPRSIDVVGEVTDPDPYLRAADVVVVPSIQDESFGLVAIEAFARGRPVIGSDSGGLRETIAGGAGWLVPAGNHRALAERMRSLTRSEIADAGRAARERYERLYSRQAFAAGLRSALGL